jgi:hypothetical protein
MKSTVLQKRSGGHGATSFGLRQKIGSQHGREKSEPKKLFAGNVSRTSASAAFANVCDYAVEAAAGL